MAEEFILSEKGQMQRVKVEPHTPLLDVLRNDLGLNNLTSLKQRPNQANLQFL